MPELIQLIFFFLMRNTVTFIYEEDRYIVSWNTKDSINCGHSSIQVTKSWIPLAWCAKACAGLFPCLRTCWTWKCLKSSNFSWMLSMMSTIAAGGVVEPDRIVKTMLESVSNCWCCGYNVIYNNERHLW